MSRLSDVEVAAIQDILRANSAIDVVAICWQAGVSMRTAIAYQIKVARIPTSNVIYAKNGIDYPRTAAELKRRLSEILP